jgi:serine/alanine adding enzyme
MAQMKYDIVSNAKNINLAALENFVTNHPCGNFFQSPQYFEFYRVQKEYVPVLVCAVDSNNKILGSVICIVNRLLPSWKFSFLSRAIVFGGPLISEEVQEKETVMDSLLKELSRLVKKESVYLEFRNLFDVSCYRKIFEKYGFAFNDHLNFVIDSSDRETVMKNMSKSKLQQIKKGLAAGAVISIAKDIEEVKQFYQLVINLYKYKVKKPFPKWDFFENFFNQGDKLGMYVIVKYNNKVVAGMMCPIYNNRIIYDWYVSGEDREYKNIYPSVLVTWGAIDYAVTNNIPQYDFLGAGKPKLEYGVREFKAQFGGELINNGRYANTFNQTMYNFSQWILKRLGYFK